MKWLCAFLRGLHGSLYRFLKRFINLLPSRKRKCNWCPFVPTHPSSRPNVLTEFTIYMFIYPLRIVNGP